MRILELNDETKKDILTNLLKRSPNSYGEYEGRVNAIIEDIKARRDEAVFEYTAKFDGFNLNENNIVVTEEEIAAAYEEIDSELVEIIRRALVNIREYHEKQKRNSWFDAKPEIKAAYDVIPSIYNLTSLPNFLKKIKDEGFVTDSLF